MMPTVPHERTPLISTRPAALDARESLYIALVAIGVLVAAVAILHMAISAVWNGLLVVAGAGVWLAVCAAHALDPDEEAER